MSEAIRERTRRAIAAILTAGGVWTFCLIPKFVGVLREQWPVAVAAGETFVVYLNGAIFLGFIAMAASAVVGGILLWRNHRLGRPLSTVVLAAQVPFLAMPLLQYKVALWGLVGFGFAGSRIGFFFEAGPQMFLEFDPDDLRAFVVNIPALVMLVALLRKAPRTTDHPQAPSAEVPSAAMLDNKALQTDGASRRR